MIALLIAVLLIPLIPVAFFGWVVILAYLAEIFFGPEGV